MKNERTGISGKSGNRTGRITAGEHGADVRKDEKPV
jgi:hypothetical protein